MQSDERSARRRKGNRVEWCFGTPAQKQDPSLVTTYAKLKYISVIVQGCFWAKGGIIGRSDLYVVDRDFKSKKHGYSARSYLDVLEDQIPKCQEPGLIFMQDGALIHTAKLVMDWFKEMGIPVEDWPLYSPNMNPIPPKKACTRPPP